MPHLTVKKAWQIPMWTMVVQNRMSMQWEPESSDPYDVRFDVPVVQIGFRNGILYNGCSCSSSFMFIFMVMFTFMFIFIDIDTGTDTDIDMDMDIPGLGYQILALVKV